MRQPDDSTHPQKAAGNRSANRPAKEAQKIDQSMHRGVFLLEPDAKRNLQWRARYRDPDTKQIRTERVPTHVHDSVPGRRRYAVELLGRLQRRKAEIEAGATPHVDADLPLADAFERYFTDELVHKRPRTQRAYRDPCHAFLEWAAANGVRTVRQLTRGRLKAFAAYVAQQPSTRGGALAPRTIAKTLRSVGTALNWLHDADVTRLGRDDVRRGLKPARKPVKRRKRPFLEPEQIAEVLAFAREHDDIRHKATKEIPYVPKGQRHPTKRYAPVEPVIRFLLLSGLRLDELVQMRVGDVHLKHGYFDVPDSKTKEAREVRFEVAPSMIAMLEPRVHARGADARVFNEHTRGSLEGALRRLQAARRGKSTAPFNYQTLRVTCATYLANMRRFGPVYESKQLGHSIQIAQDFYVDRVSLSDKIRTLEQAMQLGRELRSL